MYCGNCGTANPESGRFCIKCGTALASVSVPQQGTPSMLNVPLGIPPSAYAAGAPPPFAGTPQRSGKALASLICGLFSWIFPSAVAAIILGHFSLSEINRAAGRLKGRGMAVAGLVLGYGGILMVPSS
jgi:Domain of unknown function (DUF4190)